MYCIRTQVLLLMHHTTLDTAKFASLKKSLAPANAAGNTRAQYNRQNSFSQQTLHRFSSNAVCSFAELKISNKTQQKAKTVVDACCSINKTNMLTSYDPKCLKYRFTAIDLTVVTNSISQDQTVQYCNIYKQALNVVKTKLTRNTNGKELFIGRSQQLTTCLPMHPSFPKQKQTSASAEQHAFKNATKHTESCVMVHTNLTHKHLANRAQLQDTTVPVGQYPIIRIIVYTTRKRVLQFIAVITEIQTLRSGEEPTTGMHTVKEKNI